jgi:DNA-binding transcriptional MocR family regulator
LLKIYIFCDIFPDWMDPKIKFPRVRLKRGGPVPLYRQLRDAILEAVRNGTIPVGSRLPPTRELARRLGVNRTTVCSAYEKLEAEGNVVSRVGRGTTVVRAGGEPAGRPDPPAAGVGPVRFSQAMRSLRRGDPDRAPEGDTNGGAGEIDLSRLLPDERLFPVRPFRQIVHQVLAREGRELLQYGPAQGHPPLRRILAERLTRRGLPAEADRLLIVSGAQQGLDIVFRTFLDPNDVVVVESPTYSQVLPLLRFHRARIVGVPVRDEGLDLDLLGNVLAADAPKLIYTMPSRHNPTGVTTSPQHRRRLVDLADRYRVPVLEDGFEEDIDSGSRIPLPLKAFDAGGRVIHLGTFSKGLFPGLRIGWILAEAGIITATAEAKSLSDYHTSLLTQAALAEFCRQGHYDTHLRRLGRVFRRRLRVALRAMHAEFPGEVGWTRPEGGYCIWVQLPPGLSSDRLWREAARRGVRIAPGRPFFPDGSGRRFFRISISRVDEEEIRTGIGRLGEVLARMLEEREEAPEVPATVETIPYI